MMLVELGQWIQQIKMCSTQPPFMYTIASADTCNILRTSDKLNYKFNLKRRRGAIGCALWRIYKNIHVWIPDRNQMHDSYSFKPLYCAWYVYVLFKPFRNQPWIFHVRIFNMIKKKKKKKQHWKYMSCIAVRMHCLA